MKKTYSLLIISIAIIATTLIYWTSKPHLQEKQTQDAPCFLLLSDVHLNTFAKTCNYGDDTGMDLWNSLKTKLEGVFNGKNPPKFVIYTGDLPAHYSCSQTCYLPPKDRAAHNANIIKILEDLRQLVAVHHIPLFYLPGNNDALSGDYYAFADSAHQTPLDLIPEKTNPYPALNVQRTGNVPPCIVDSYDPQAGYYAAKPMKGLRVIALNSVILGKSYYPLSGISQTIAGNAEMDWLREELKKANDAGEKVYIAMHIPPGVDAYAFDKKSAQPYMWAHLPSGNNSWLNAFLKLTTIYQSTIAGVFYGHTHEDELRRLYDSTGTKITEVAISCPGITPQHYNNPGFKLVYYNSASFQPTDFETFYTRPIATAWGNSSYRFSDIFHDPDGATIYDVLKSRPLKEVNTQMDSIYTVMHGSSGYDTSPGIEVKPGE